ncbi:MAG: helix-turn-helix domain-containing protein [Pseudomonas kermanshahensis]|uniref:helix-turn-helix domain-containing protein n=1 Tax=Pseudomonas kermanshahensis TaxID=2745482 RepID=UPI003D0AA8A0
MDVAKAFGSVLRIERKRAGLTQEQLALICGYQRNYMSLLERGVHQPTLKTIFDLAGALHCDPVDMVAQVARMMSQS